MKTEQKIAKQIAEGCHFSLTEINSAFAGINALTGKAGSELLAMVKQAVNTATECQISLKEASIKLF